MEKKERDRHIVDTGATVREALKAINALSGEAMTLFATGSGGRLEGTVTDGDIRRALIAGADLDDAVERVMHREFMRVETGDDLVVKAAEARRRKIDLLPLTEEGRIRDILDLRRLRTILPVDAVLMAGGKGERLRPLTLSTPKPLLKVGGKPIIDYNVEELARHGVKNIFVTVNYLREQIMEHFSRPVDGSRVICVEEPCRLGTMGSLTLVEGLTHDNVIVMNSDLLTDLDFEKLYLHHVTGGAALTVAAIPYTVSVPFAIMKVEDDRVTALEEKPTYNYFANAGVYILKRSLIERMGKGEYLDAPDFVAELVAAGEKVCCFPVNGTWVDIGSPDDYRHACQLMERNMKKH